MIRLNLFVPQEYIKFLKEYNKITVSEHTRRAMDEYIQKLRGLNVSASASRKVGDTNGQ